ncbi:hypothetical protein ID853_17465 [Xenorhabdus sp. Vera]|uniref:hypothetical protein n=1 Tax=Xenorhabdus koppenhoeferi TaxID=351659 RepID=UPI0019B72E2E|nr:hypothetical protein [Xenorhabdus sp. Vera]MBD2812615.1 hypothetical protein [Xenorhabdus sp. Vera]
MATITLNKIWVGLLLWAICIIHPVQANKSRFSHQPQPQPAFPLETPAAILDSQHQQQKTLLEDAQQQREDLQKKQTLPIQSADDPLLPYHC